MQSNCCPEILGEVLDDHKETIQSVTARERFDCKKQNSRSGKKNQITFYIVG